MTLSAEAARGHIDYALNSAGVDPLIGGHMAMINRAGRVMSGMRNWAYLRRIAELDLVAGEYDVDMPSDFVKLEAQESSETIVGAVSLVGMQELLRLRANVASGSGNNYRGAIFAKDNAATNGGPPTYVLKLDRPVVTAQSNAFTIVYYTGWQSVSEDTNEIKIPEFMDELFLQVLRAYVQDYAFENMNGKNYRSLDERMRGIYRGVIFEAACRDDQPQDEFGAIEGGHTEEGSYFRDWGSDSTVGDIS